MPIEKERKFVIRVDSEEEISKLARCKKLIKQGYLCSANGTTVRIRSEDAKNFILTVKSKVHGYCIEMETGIAWKDFNLLWFGPTTNKLTKYRYVIPFVPDVAKDRGATTSTCKWEVDYFKDEENNNYIAVAEYEYSEFASFDFWMPKLPDWIERNLLYAVPEGDNKWSSKNLADKETALELLESINS
jgi:CYTH domain-containing protein